MAGPIEPTNPAKEEAGNTLNWNWLSARIEPGSNLMLSEWLDDQLNDLETQFADFATEKSLNRSARQTDEDQRRE
ncbi:MAG: hypothetical protein Aurels2KO_07470 [Aureliella sp.]